ncbi:MAG: nitroreductase family protein [Pseudomonadota bacterium]
MLKSLENRRTYKIIGNPASPEPITDLKAVELNALLAAAGNAPFHYACDRTHQKELASPVPWRAYVLSGNACRKLMGHMIEAGDTTKIPNMLAAAQTLLQITWLPDPGTIIEDRSAKDTPIFEGTHRNMEHIAAASAFVQSLLLAADSSGFKTYWSSGGPLREGYIFDWMKIPSDQLLIGSVFLFAEQQQEAETKAGALADKRGSVSDWARQVEIT